MRKLSVFILGMPRSGTKLLRYLLNNHPSLYISEIEVLFIPRLLKKYGDKKLDEAEIKSVIKEIKKTPFFFYYLKEKKFDFSQLESSNITIVQFINILFECLAENDKPHCKMFGDKSPNYLMNIDLLTDYFPDAYFIHIVRDPRDRALSMQKAWKKNIYRSAYRWAEAMSSLNRVKSLKEIKLIEIKYEDLIDETSEVKIGRAHV